MSSYMLELNILNINEYLSVSSFYKITILISSKM